MKAVNGIIVEEAIKIEKKNKLGFPRTMAEFIFDELFDNISDYLSDYDLVKLILTNKKIYNRYINIKNIIFEKRNRYIDIKIEKKK